MTYKLEPDLVRYMKKQHVVTRPTMWLNTDRIYYRRYASYRAREDHDWYACNVTFYCHAVQLQITTQHHKKVLLICLYLNPWSYPQTQTLKPSCGAA